MSQTKRAAAGTLGIPLLVRVDDAAKPERICQLLDDLVPRRIGQARPLASRVKVHESPEGTVTPSVETNRAVLTRDGLRELISIAARSERVGHKEFCRLLAELVLPHIDRVRLFTLQAGERRMPGENPISDIKNGTVALTREGLRKTDGLRITVDLIFRQEDGTIGFDVETEAVLVGEGIPALETTTPVRDGPIDYEDPTTDDCVSAQEAADELGVDKATVTQRIESNRLLGYQGLKGGWLLPRAQFRDGDVVPGVAETIAMFDNKHRKTWLFLSSRFFYGDDNPRPIDRLRALKRGDETALEACVTELEAVKSSHDHGAHF